MQKQLVVLHVVPAIFITRTCNCQMQVLELGLDCSVDADSVQH